MAISTFVIAALSLIFMYHILKFSANHNKIYDKNFEKHFPELDRSRSFGNIRNIIDEIIRGIQFKIDNSKDPSKEKFYLRGEFNDILNEPNIGDLFTMLAVFAAVGIAYINKVYHDLVIYYVLLCVIVVGFMMMAYKRHLRGVNIKFYKMCIFILESYEFQVPNKETEVEDQQKDVGTILQ